MQPQKYILSQTNKIEVPFGVFIFLNLLQGLISGEARLVFVPFGVFIFLNV